MTDNAKKTSELATANTIASSDRLLFLYNATGAPSTRTITVNNFITTLIPGPYADDAAAAAANVQLKGMYYSVEGVVKIRII